MIHIILYWILSIADAPTFIWIAFWLHLVGSMFQFLGSFLKGKSNIINLKDIGRDEEF